MTVPTSDERREVAAMIRDSVHADDYLDVVIVMSIYKVMGSQNRPVGFVLADLIDPTCHDLGGEEGTNFEGYDFGCSECGYVCDLPQPNYCPNCGARVVGE